MDLHYEKEITVGTLVLVGIAVFVAGTMFLKGASFRPLERTAEVRFADIGTLKKDNEVAVSGYPVGKVVSVEFKAPGDVRVTVSLPPTLDLRADASAEISSGVFSSDSRILLHPGTAAEKLPDGAVVRGASGAGIFEKGAALADRADSVLIGVQAVANQRTGDELVATLKAMQRTLNRLSDRLPQTAGEAERTMAAFRRLAERLDTTIAAVPVASAVERADTLARNMSTMSIQLTATGARLDTLLQKINAGEGTLGKFATDSGLYLDSREAMQALKVLLEELNKHPGKLNIQVKLF
ncbi:MAG: MlaD family protein [Gemmatimonadota bacterium]|nr:MlaD family protein [Gemmatimonadota bacterium]